VRILGLQPGDTLEYRVTTAITKPPLAPHFWLDHNFDRTGIVTEERFQVTLPASILASAPLIVVHNRYVRQQLESRLYPAPGCGECVPPDYSQPIDLSDSAVKMLLHPKREKRVAQPAKPADAAPPPPPEETLPPIEFGKIELLVKPFAADVTVGKSGDGNDVLSTYTW